MRRRRISDENEASRADTAYSSARRSPTGHAWAGVRARRDDGVVDSVFDFPSESAPLLGRAGDDSGDELREFEAPAEPPAMRSMSESTLSLRSSMAAWWARLSALFWQLLPGRAQAVADEEDLPLDMLRRVDSFRQFVSLPYDSSDPAMERMLSLYWTLAMPDTPLEARISKQWGRLGFQGKDPATDFRAAGYFGLCNCVYFAVEYGAAFRRMRARVEADGYPFSIAGLSITMLLFNCIGWGHPLFSARPGTRQAFTRLLFAVDRDLVFDAALAEPAPGGAGAPAVPLGRLIDFGDEPSDADRPLPGALPSLAEAPAATAMPARLVHRKGRTADSYLFEEAFCAAFFLLHAKWFELNATYMDFPNVIREAGREFEDAMRAWADFSAVRAFNAAAATRVLADDPSASSGVQ